MHTCTYKLAAYKHVLIRKYYRQHCILWTIKTCNWKSYDEGLVIQFFPTTHHEWDTVHHKGTAPLPVYDYILNGFIYFVLIYIILFTNIYTYII